MRNEIKLSTRPFTIQEKKEKREKEKQFTNTLVGAVHTKTRPVATVNICCGEGVEEPFRRSSN